MTSAAVPRNLIADLLADEPDAARFVAELERATGFPFVVEVGWALHDALSELHRGVAPSTGEGSADSVATYIVRTEGEQYASDVIAAVYARRDDVGAVAERLGPSRLTFDADFWSPTDEAARWLVEPLLARGRGHLLYAPAKAGKSLFALYVAASLAAGRAVLSRPAGPPTPVLYVDSEMTKDDVRARMVAMGFGPADNLSAFHYFWLPDLLPLDSARGGADLLNLALDTGAELVVIDTIGKTLGGDENANDTAQNFAVHSGTPLKRAGITLWRIDHSGKDGDRGARGASAKNDDPDVVWRFTADSGRVALKATYKRVPWVPDDLSLRCARNPIRYTLDAPADDGGVAIDAATLDRLRVPLNFGKERARPVLTKAGESMSNDRLLAAQRFRREREEEQGGHE
jgi:hypothetical protein